MIQLMAALVAMAAAPAAAQAHDHEQHQAAPGALVDPDIDAFVCNYFGLVEKGEPDAILAQVDEDFVIKWPSGQPITDRSVLRAALDKMQRDVRQTIRWRTLETGVHGDWAWARVEESAVHQPRAGGAPRTLNGSHLMILRKRDGRWLLHRDVAALN